MYPAFYITALKPLSCFLYATELREIAVSSVTPFRDVLSDHGGDGLGDFQPERFDVFFSPDPRTITPNLRPLPPPLFRSRPSPLGALLPGLSGAGQGAAGGHAGGSAVRGVRGGRRLQIPLSALRCRIVSAGREGGRRRRRGGERGGGPKGGGLRAASLRGLPA